MMKRFAALLIGVSLTSGAWAAAADVKDYLLSGSKFVQDKKIDEAIREFENAISADPNNAEAHLLLGLALANKKDFDRAIDHTLRSVAISPSYSAYNNLGLLYANKGQFQNGIDAYENALKINPKSYVAWHQLGKIASSNADFTKAIEAFGKATELNSKFPEAYQGLGSAYYMNGDMTSALQQVGRLEKMQFKDKATELESWIKDKEIKKAKALKKLPAKTAQA
jgi:tetratricopeptide (TPR) repeat protein